MLIRCIPQLLKFQKDDLVVDHAADSQFVLCELLDQEAEAVLDRTAIQDSVLEAILGHFTVSCIIKVNILYETVS